MKLVLHDSRKSKTIFVKFDRFKNILETCFIWFNWT